ncbi:MAG: hypothetical protein WAZ14_03365 [Patescibacteria group bacterium]
MIESETLRSFLGYLPVQQRSWTVIMLEQYPELQAEFIQNVLAKMGALQSDNRQDLQTLQKSEAKKLQAFVDELAKTEHRLKLASL